MNHLKTILYISAASLMMWGGASLQAVPAMGLTGQEVSAVIYWNRGPGHVRYHRYYYPRNRYRYYRYNHPHWRYYNSPYYNPNYYYYYEPRYHHRGQGGGIYFRFR